MIIGNLKLPASFMIILVINFFASVQITVRWLKLLLEIHTKEPTTDELRDRFGLLLAVIENRFSSYVPMAKLRRKNDKFLRRKFTSSVCF